jgi:hypothetical protein
VKAIAPQFVVPDEVAAAEYYRDFLGIRILGFFGQLPVFSTVARDNAEIQLGKADSAAGPAHDSVPRDSGLDAYVGVTSVDSFHAQFKERGAKIVASPQVRVSKCFVENNFGFRLAFAMDMQSPT